MKLDVTLPWRTYLRRKNMDTTLNSRKLDSEMLHGSLERLLGRF